MEIGDTLDKTIQHDIINLFGTESILPKDTAKKGILGVISFIFILFLPEHLPTIKTIPFSLLFKCMKWYFTLSFPGLLYAAASAMLKSKASLLGKESWGHFVASLVGTKTSGLCDILEDFFDECPETEEEEGQPSKKIYLEDEPSTSSDPSAPKPPTIPSSKIEVTFPINEGSLQESGISHKFLPIGEQLPYRKAIYLCGFNCGHCAQSRATVFTHTCKRHLNIMLGCPHYDHHVWSTDAWVKHVCTCYP